MIGLIREESGIFKQNNSINLDTDYKNNLITIEQVLPNMPKIEVNEKYYVKLTNGVAIPYNQNINECLVYCKNELFGIGNITNNILKVKINLREI